MANDWRVTVTLHGAEQAGQVVDSLREHEAGDDALRRLGRRVAVSADGPAVFLYAGTEDAAREADRVVRGLVAAQGLTADFALDRWHPIAGEWQGAEVATPQTDAERQAEHQRLEQEETRESVATGVAEWEVRVEMPSRHTAVDLAERLQAEGHPAVRRWTLLVLGANDEDDAIALAQAVRQQAPAAASVEVAQAGPLLPFAQYGPISIW